MKNLKRRLSLVLVLMLILTSFEVIGVFAEDTTTTEVKAITAEELTLSGTVAQASYNSVVVRWTKNEKATSYIVTGNGTTQTVVQADNPSFTFVNLDPYAETDYAFTVQAVHAYTDEEITKINATITDESQKLQSGTVVNGAVVTVTGKPVRDIYYQLKIKTSGTLRSHAGKRASMKVKAGQTVYAYGFAGGKYILRNEGSVYYVARTRVGNKKAIYSHGSYYSREEAQNYVNARGIGSSTGSLIWVSTYTQHLYLFTGTAGAWTCVDDWEISTGLASSPTPTSIDGIKRITKHTKSRHGIKWWSFFHGTAGFHGLKKGWAKKLGSPASNGCIRNPVAKAKVLYDLGKGTRVIIF